MYNNGKKGAGVLLAVVFSALSSFHFSVFFCSFPCPLIIDNVISIWERSERPCLAVLSFLPLNFSCLSLMFITLLLFASFTEMRRF